MTDAEITKIADQLGLYDIQDGGRVNGGTLLDFARAILDAQLAEAAAQPIAPANDGANKT